MEPEKLELLQAGPVTQALERMTEQVDSLEREVAYARTVCTRFKGEHVFYTELLERLEIVSDLIGTSKQALDRFASTWSTKYAEANGELGTACEIVDFLPEMLQTIADSLTQRRLPAIRNWYGGGPAYSFADVHPDYQTTVVAIESIVRDYYSAFAPLVGPSKLPPPLVTISKEERFSAVNCFGKLLHDVSSLDDPKELDVKVIDVVYRIRSAAALSRITAPRWTPVTLRSAPICAHELAHLFISLSRTFNTLLDVRKVGEKGRDLAEREFAKVFGKRLLDFTHDVNELREGLILLLEDSLGCDRRQKGEQKETLTDKHRMRLGHQVDEIIADCLALVVAGPALACSLVSELVLNPSSLPLGVKDGAKGLPGDVAVNEVVFGWHPPIPVRLKCLDLMCRKLGWNEVANHLFESDQTRVLVRQMEQTLSLDELYSVARPVYDAWFSNHTLKLLEICRLLKTKELEARFPLSEKVLREVSEYMIGELRGGNVFELTFHSENGDDIKVTPALLVVAMWHRICFHGEVGSLGTRWRQAIVHCGAGATDASHGRV